MEEKEGKRKRRRKIEWEEENTELCDPRDPPAERQTVQTSTIADFRFWTGKGIRRLVAGVSVNEAFVCILINGPPSGTRPAVFASSLKSAGAAAGRPQRQRKPNELRKIFLKTGLIPTASGSAYLEFEPSASLAAARSSPQSLIPPSSALKLACTVHGPKPLPRSATFSPNLVLTTHVKYAPFAARRRKGHIRDASERDLGVHLETALRGVIVAERWPKSGLDITVTILEAEDDRWWGDAPDSHDAPWGMMNVLAGCITAASAAIADARIDCLGLVAGGVAALVRDESAEGKNSTPRLMLDTDPAEHRSILSACVVAYIPSRDEITEIWLKGDSSKVQLGPDDKRTGHDALIDGAVDAARGAHTVLAEAVRESAERFAGLATGGSAL